MLRDIDYARLCQRTYDAPEPSLIHGGETLTGRHDNFALSAEPVDELHTLCFRGSKNRADWLLDLFAFPAFDIHTVRHATLGPLHAGFLIGALSLYPYVRSAVAGRQYALCGHSLGGALATVMAALLTRDGNPPHEVVTFGAPRAGMDPMARILDPVTIRQYRFSEDPVPWVPTHPPFIHARTPLIQLGHATDHLFSNHHITNYIAALEQAHATEPPAALAG